MTTPLTIYIGFDPREEDAFKVCKDSILRHATIPIRIVKLDLDSLRALGFYSRPFRKEGNQYIDERDGRPFSTEFAFSRFLVPELQGFDGWAIFVDCDFLFTGDIGEIVPLLNYRHPVMCVQHNYVPAETVKMDGVSQGVYPRKNWSSFMAFNCSHPFNSVLTLEVVNSKPGKWLHGFQWLEDKDIGHLPKTWNWLAGVDEQLDEVPMAIHFTLGTPDLKGYEDSPYADLWREELTRSAIKESNNGKKLYA